MPLRSLAACGFAFAAAALVPQVAHAEDRSAACVAAADRGQVLRDDGHLVQSRAEFAACGAEECPVVVRRECLRWLAEIDERLPSVIVSVKSARGEDVVGAVVRLDGVARPDAALGRAVLVDAGPHAVRAEHPDYQVAAQEVVVREREKGRVVTLVLQPRAAAALAATDAGARSDDTTSRGVPWLTYALGGVAVGGFVGFGVLWNAGMNDVSRLRGTCAPYCTDEEIDKPRTTLNLARVSLGVGIAAAIGAAVVALVAPSRPSSPPRARATARASAP